MNTDTTLEIKSTEPEHTLRIAAKIGAKLKGYEVIELCSDVGGGKTTFTKGLLTGLGYSGVVASPTFTISQEYALSGKIVHHFDFYRLDDPGVMAAELAESVADPQVVVVVEWADTVQEVLPKDRLIVTIVPVAEDSRRLVFTAGEQHKHLLESLV